MKTILKKWIPLAFTITLLCGLLYAVAQQNYRMGADDPQVQISEDIAQILEQGEDPRNLEQESKIDIAKTLAPFISVYGDDGKVIASTGQLNDQPLSIDQGVLDAAKQHKQNRITWKPEGNVRVALVVTRYEGPTPGYVAVGRSLRDVEAPNNTNIDTGALETLPQNTNTIPVETNRAPEVVEQNLKVPWEIVFLPNGDMLVTERAGTLQRFGKIRATIQVPNVKAAGESGLLGMVIHPDFTSNNFVYLYFTIPDGTNQIVRYTLTGSALNDPATIIQNIPGANYHDGGRIAFGPDSKLYITTGDAQDESNSQNTQSLGGKILRINDDGSIPTDNPFGNAVYSIGHRNPQGLDWDSQDQLWATEHGRSGVRSGYDELNRIEKGKNYGWPTIEGDATKSGLERPVQHSGPSTTWAPADIAIIGNTLYFGGLRGQSLYETALSGTSTGAIKANFGQTYGRIRALTVYDGYLYFATSNQDGRGEPQSGDDKILRLKLNQ